MPDRVKHHDTIDAALMQWTSGQDKLSVMNACQARGIPAGAVLDMAEVLTNDHIVARGTYEVVTNEALGENRLHLGPPYRLSRTPATTDGPAAATLGQHNEAIFCGALGLSRSALDSLTEAGVIGRGSESDDEETGPRPEFGPVDPDFKMKLGL